jgi:pimeloyl-ACP methyl ester carboxylesterase
LSVFGFVHGGGHGPSCWAPLVPELEARGHSVLLADLPVEDPGAGLGDYADAAAAAFADHPGEVVVVVHSLSGLVGPLIPERLDVRHLVFLCSMLPEPGQSAADQLAADPSMNNPAIAPADTEQLESIDPSPEMAIELLYQDCDRAQALAAVAAMRMQAERPWSEKSPLREWPEVPTTYIYGSQDQCVMPDWFSRTVRERFGAEPIALPTGHSPFLARPAELAAVLDGLELDRPVGRASA